MFVCIELLFLVLFGYLRISPSVVSMSTQTAMITALALKRDLTLQSIPKTMSISLVQHIAEIISGYTLPIALIGGTTNQSL
ncbi:hypothetical protein T03_9522 [Trichinella britovi]|uniref:Uncharacterized protein n=1 Tax=Trichinella britovi TaxID=45882 RepID=A0A0V1D934_TRIBR|nr:hypothetical protein T03_9522 [Trichinella britovi]